jgi:hypothetical protein
VTSARGMPSASSMQYTPSATFRHIADTLDDALCLRKGAQVQARASNGADDCLPCKDYSVRLYRGIKVAPAAPQAQETLRLGRAHGH